MMSDEPSEKAVKDSLRQQALNALSSGQIDVKNLSQDQQHSIEAILEELRIYHAELELQNQSLRATQAQLETSQQNYLNLFQQLPIAALVVDQHGMIQQVNQQAIALFAQAKRQHLLNHSIYRLFSGESANWLAQIMMKKSSLISHQQLNLVQTNQLVPVHAYAVHHDQEDYFRQLSIIMLVDLRAEVAAQKQMQLLESLLKNTNALIYAFDLNGKCILANNAFIQLLGFKQLKQVIGQTYEQLLLPEKAYLLRQQNKAVFKNACAMSFEETHDHDNQPQYLLSQRFPLYDDHQAIYAIATISNDITEQRLNEQKLSLTTKVFENSHEGIMICDAEVNIVSVNHSFETITGYTEAEVLGKNPRLLSAGKTPLSTYKAMWQDLLTLGFWQGELWNRRKNKESYPQQLSISVVRNHQSMISHYVGIFADITARKQAEEQIHQLAFYDLLTGAANRYLLRNQVEKLLTSDTPNTCFTLMFLDLDHFKEINDVFGHDVGDQLLKIVTKRLSEQFHEQETICRLGGDEFVVLLPNKHCDDLAEQTNAVLHSLIQPYHIQGHALKVSASIGVSTYPQHGNTYSELLKFADLAMYHAKSSGRNAYFCFEPWMADNLHKNVTLQMALQQAIARNELHVVFQPQLHSATQSIIGFEVLTRWNHPTLGNISPDVFIPLAEKSDFMIELTDWILTQALDGLSQITALGYANLRVAVNISAREFKQQELFQRIQQHLFAYPTLSAHQLELELTERMAMLEPDRILHILHALNSLGVRIAIDDFGTGYSSLSYLKKYPIQALKIDRSFIQDIGKDSDDEAVCQSILALSGALQLETIAEGVETEQQAQWLRAHGCSSCQGYLIAKPMPLATLIDWLAAYESSA